VPSSASGTAVPVSVLPRRWTEALHSSTRLPPPADKDRTGGGGSRGLETSPGANRNYEVPTETEAGSVDFKHLFASVNRTSKQQQGRSGGGRGGGSLLSPANDTVGGTVGDRDRGVDGLGLVPSGWGSGGTGMPLLSMRATRPPHSATATEEGRVGSGVRSGGNNRGTSSQPPLGPFSPLLSSSSSVGELTIGDSLNGDDDIVYNNYDHSSSNVPTFSAYDGNNRATVSGTAGRTAIRNSGHFATGNSMATNRVGRGGKAEVREQNKANSIYCQRSLSYNLFSSQSSRE
jgi:hypothetical protein